MLASALPWGRAANSASSPSGRILPLSKLLPLGQRSRVLRMRYQTSPSWKFWGRCRCQLRPSARTQSDVDLQVAKVFCIGRSSPLPLLLADAGRSEKDVAEESLAPACSWSQVEVDHLQQRLADSMEEKTIQVAIIQDEVAEKQKVIDELTVRCAEAVAGMAAMRERLAGSTQSKSSETEDCTPLTHYR